MSLDNKNLVALALAYANANPSAPVAYSYEGENFSYSQLQEAFREQLNEIAGTPQLYRRNQNQIFELMEQIIDDVLPKKVLAQYGEFAEIKTIPQGTTAVFKQKITEQSRRRAKQFVTRVGLAGVYEVFKLDGRSFEVPVTAYGGAARIEIEEFLDGRITMADLLDIVLEGLDEAVYREIAHALIGCVTQLPGANISDSDDWDEGEMDRLLQIADAYGQSTIYCTFEFAARMIPEAGWISDEMRNTRWNNGHLGNYKNHRVVILDQSFEDLENEVKVINPGYAWIMPSGNDSKPVKIAFEGQSQVKEVENEDWSREIRTYTKFGVATIVTNNMCVFRNKDLALDMDENPTLKG